MGDKLTCRDTERIIEEMMTRKSSFDEAVTGALEIHEKELGWMGPVLLEFKKQRPRRYQRSWIPRLQWLFYRIKHVWPK